MIYKTLPIMTVTDLRNKFPMVEKTFLNEKTPIIFTKNGRSSMVLMDADEFNAQQKEIEMLRAEVARLQNIEKELKAVEETYGSLLEAQLDEIDAMDNKEPITHEEFMSKMKERFKWR